MSMPAATMRPDMSAAITASRSGRTATLGNGAIFVANAGPGVVVARTHPPGQPSIPATTGSPDGPSA